MRVGDDTIRMAAAVRVFVNAVDSYTSSQIGEVRGSHFVCAWFVETERK